MDKKELQEKLDKKVSEIIGMCVNEKDAKEALEEILSLKGQLEHVPTRISIQEDSIKKEIEGSHFYLAKTNREIIFHVRGGYTVIFDEPIPLNPELSGDVSTIAGAGFKTSYDSLDFFFEGQERYDSLSDEDKATYDAILQATAIVLELPTFAFHDDEFLLDIATQCTRQLQNLYDKNKELLEKQGLPEDVPNAYYDAMKEKLEEGQAEKE